MTTIDVKKITLDDVEQLQKIARQTFSETFSSDNSEEDMNKYLEEELSSEKLKAELAHKSSEFYFAILENNIAGYLKINYGQSQTEIRESNTLEIERIYVLKEYQGKKIGQKLYEKAIESARRKSVDYIWLGVWEHNTGAIRFYKKNGFMEFDKHIFKLGNDEQTDIMMKLDLKKQQ